MWLRRKSELLQAARTALLHSEHVACLHKQYVKNGFLPPSHQRHVLTLRARQAHSMGAFDTPTDDSGARLLCSERLSDVTFTTLTGGRLRSCASNGCTSAGGQPPVSWSRTLELWSGSCDDISFLRSPCGAAGGRGLMGL